MQAVRTMQRHDAGESVRDVCKLHQIPSRHYKWDTKGTECSVLQRVRALPTATADVDCMRVGVAGASHRVYQALEGTKQGQARRRSVCLDRAPLQAH